ncbi:Transcriptional regulatory protein RcsB [Dyadobacter sp. CECT 9275]|uniref:Transcriptional regulatory protein RcsB n=1 Tax=Dyadobacter helix TaxID=2822344 RepID=A0A916JFZ2_9BACT|nr:response regulator transcription factor [Dyadobacter sp. CECT 9275]CAG5012911.1 Transcriptional regulatory protein RcsB [Dyadobacter sp. CECT 9275]
MKKLLLFVCNDFYRIGMVVSVREFDPEADFHYAESLEDSLNALKEVDFDILIADLRLSDPASLAYIGMIQSVRPSIKIMVLGEENEKVWALPFYKNGVHAICLKSMRKQEFYMALQAVSNGKKYMFEGLTDFLLEGLVEHNLMNLLSKRETEVLDYLVKGFRTAEIAAHLALRPSTISTVKANVYHKMQVTNLIDLISKVKFNPKYAEF